MVAVCLSFVAAIVGMALLELPRPVTVERLDGPEEGVKAWTNELEDAR